MHGWRTGKTAAAEQTGQGTYMMHSQDKFGWEYALEGVITTQWCIQQDQYWQQIKSLHSARWWTVEVIIKNCGM